MVAYINAAALEQTIATGEAHYWSRSRQEVWHKGGTSGNVQKVVELLVDCDQDAIWMKVEPAGPACHTGAASCFYRRLSDGRQRPDALFIILRILGIGEIGRAHV